jgi:hypothetical protein
MRKLTKRQDYRFLEAEVYRLVLAKGDTMRAEGVLWSRHLDRGMHVEPRVPVMFAGSSEEAGLGNAILDSFQLTSMVEYLERQEVVRRAIEVASIEHPALSELGFAKGPRLWTKVRVAALLLEARELKPTKSELRHLAYPEALVRDSDAWDTRETRSKWTLAIEGRATGLRGRPWTDGHQRFCMFRDGSFVQLWREG